MTFPDQQLTFMTFQAWKMKKIQFHDLYEP